MKILITRPEPKAQELKNLCSNAGFEVNVVPLLAIQPIAKKLWQAELSNLKNIDGLIFVSPTAAQLFQDTDLQALPAFAVGQSTAATLKMHGFKQVISPETQENSEALLALPELHNVRDKHLLIIRGTTGRELIAKTLSARGAHIHYLAVYDTIRRTLTQTELSQLQQHYDVVVITSTEALRYFLELREPGAEKITVMAGQMQTLAEPVYGKQMLVLNSVNNQNILYQLRCHPRVGGDPCG